MDCLTLLPRIGGCRASRPEQWGSNSFSQEAVTLINSMPHWTLWDSTAGWIALFPSILFHNLLNCIFIVHCWKANRGQYCSWLCLCTYEPLDRIKLNFNEVIIGWLSSELKLFASTPNLLLAEPTSPSGPPTLSSHHHANSTSHFIQTQDNLNYSLHKVHQRVPYML